MRVGFGGINFTSEIDCIDLNDIYLSSSQFHEKVFLIFAGKFCQCAEIYSIFSQPFQKDFQTLYLVFEESISVIISRQLHLRGFYSSHYSTVSSFFIVFLKLTMKISCYEMLN